MIRKGFIDLHTHGFGSYDTRAADPDGILAMARLHGRSGTAAILPTIYPGPIEQMRKEMETVRKAIEIQGSRLAGHSSVILGVHLEGPFLNPARRGVLDRTSFLKPSLSSLKKLVDGYEDIVRIITIAPEMPGALRVVEHCAVRGMKVNMGHSDATYRQACEGKKAGATGITHLFNAMRPFHHREPGLAGLGLLDRDLYVEVIADGVHLDREALRLVFKAKPAGKIVVVSDSVKGARQKGRAVYSSGGMLEGGGCPIAASTEVLKEIGISGSAIRRTTSENPRKYLGLSGEGCGV